MGVLFASFVVYAFVVLQRGRPIMIYRGLNMANRLLVELRFEQMAEAPLTI